MVWFPLYFGLNKNNVALHTNAERLPSCGKSFGTVVAREQASTIIKYALDSSTTATTTSGDASP